MFMFNVTEFEVMKTTSINKVIVLCMVVLALTNCRDYLTEPQPATTLLEDFYSSGTAAIQNVTGCYVPLMWEYNQTYYSEWFIGDIVSDDALKGGQNTSDMGSAYDMENWKTTADNTLLLDFYRAQYQGIGRCNLALKYVPDVNTDSIMNERLKQRLIGEVKFLRAYYYFRLLRVFGGVPVTLDVIEDSGKWQVDRSSVEEVFKQILSDLEDAQKVLWRVEDISTDQRGRATKGAAEAMLMKVHLYMAGPYWSKYLSNSTPADNYAAAKMWGDSIIKNDTYILNPIYHDNFTEEGENGPESVFEIQYMEMGWGDFGQGNGFTSGSFTQRLVRSRSTKESLTLGDAGWGFNRPTQCLYDEFETADSLRRKEAILVPTDEQMDDPSETSEEVYLGIRYLNNKYGWYGYRLGHHSRGPLNNKQIRYADVLLMYAEVCAELGDDVAATNALNEVRSARNMATYPGYTYTTITPDAGSELKNAIRHERRVELAMEGHRWFDLVRWYGGEGNGLDTYMNGAYKQSESKAAQGHMAEFKAGKHEIFPIPAEERELNPIMGQNDGY